jgi:hypothetical protein
LRLGSSLAPAWLRIICGHGLPASDFCGWVEGIEPEEDLFRDILWKSR